LFPALRQAVHAARIPKRVSCHTFRHSFASHLLRANFDIRTIQQLLGHSDVRTTMIYTHTVKSRTLKEMTSPLLTQLLRLDYCVALGFEAGDCELHLSKSATPRSGWRRTPPAPTSPCGPEPHVQLTVNPPSGASRQYDFAGARPVMIGRDPACDVQVDDEQCSRWHARIVREHGVMVVSDLDSTNGVFVNGAPCYRCALATGDEVRVGQTVLRVDGVPRPSTRATDLGVSQRPASVAVSLPHGEASLLDRTATDISPLEAVEENRLLRDLCGIAQSVAAAPDVTAALRDVLRQTRERLRAESACLLVRGSDGAWNVRQADSPDDAGARLIVSRSIVQAALREGVAILSNDPLHDARFAPGESLSGQELCGALCAPIRVRDAFVGVLFLVRREMGGAFIAVDLRFAATAASLLSLLLENERMRDEARQRERLATIGEVMAGLAHCVKNILTALRFSVRSLQRALEKQDLAAAGGSANHVSAQAQRISDLVLDMLTYAKERTPERGEVEVGRLLESVAAPLRAQWAEEGLALRLDADPGCPRLRAEENALYRVFLNLVGNAGDALRARSGDTPKELIVTAAPAIEGNGIEVRLRDTGTGIPPENLERVFDPFFSTKGSAGTGLGLAVARKIVREHGGDIAVDSCPGAWTEFRVILPVSEPKP